MKRDLPAFVYRKGKKGYTYFCRAGETVRIHAAPGTAEFATEYALAMKGRAPVPNGRTFTALIAKYKRSPKYEKLAPRTKADYDKVLTVLEARIGSVDPGKVKHRHVVGWQEEYSDATRFANYMVQVLSILFKHAKRIGWREDNPAQGVGMLKSGKEDREPWPPEMIEAFRLTARGSALLIGELCFGTGQRIGDVLSMRWDDVKAGGVLVKQNKTKTKLWIPLTGRLAKILGATPKRGLYIVTTRDGRPMAYKTAQGAMMRVREKIGAKAYDIHSLRYSAAEELARLGCTDAQIASITGHASLAMVKKYAGSARQIALATQAQGKRE